MRRLPVALLVLALVGAVLTGARRRRTLGSPGSGPPGTGVREPRTPPPTAPAGTAFADD